MPKQRSPQKEWEQALIDAYYDYRWRQVLQPLYEDFQRWAAGELQHGDMDQAIHAVHKQSQELYSLFTEKRSWLARVIQMDDDWFQKWVRAHPMPSPGASGGR